ncbi:hypothetical protein KP79_PYT11550 [Mizuhopecten yessoensis]|uniref:Uncharacterized protein n=1 Tax=Mizuhopecten yessoensis TaxID=6573 RepID=A0A210QWV5_MIZYE|nr:hypothetical protein KP79_PYT11550 [Mizuhopecten yessoensis]
MDDNVERPVKQREKHVRFLLDEERNARPKQQYRKTPKKLHAHQPQQRHAGKTEFGDEARKDNQIAEMYRRVIQMTEEANKLKIETCQLVGDYSELGKKFSSLEKEKKDFDDEVDRHVQEIDEKRYLNGLIHHLEEVDRNMTFEPCEVLGSSVSDGFLQNRGSLSEI